MLKGELKKAYKKGLADALRIISDGEGWEESRDYYARIMKLPTIYDKFEANKSSRK